MTNKERLTLGKWIGQTRTKLGLSIQTAAKTAGVGASTLFFTENDETSPKIHTLVKIFDVLKCEIAVTRGSQTMVLKAAPDSEAIIAETINTGRAVHLSQAEREIMDLLHDLEPEDLSRAVGMLKAAFATEKKFRKVAR